MNNKNSKFVVFLFVLTAIGSASFLFINKGGLNRQSSMSDQNTNQGGSNDKKLHPLSIEYMRKREYPGSDIVIEQTLPKGSNYYQFIVSYKSDGLKIYGLLTLPQGEIPKDGWPVIIFNHGFIPPSTYRTTERYVAYVDVFARNGYRVFKPDYRGNGNSEGQPEGTYYSAAYTTDVLNAVSSIKKFKEADPNKIGMWGHSMGGNITLKSLVVRPNDIKAAIIWAGVVGTYDDLINNWQRRVTYSPPPQQLALRNQSRAKLIEKYGTPKTNPQFWHSVDPNYHLFDITASIQIHAGLSDEQVPWSFSQGLYVRLKKLNKTVEFYTYPDDNHNISNNLSLALQRSVEFFDKYLKGGE